MPLPNKLAPLSLPVSHKCMQKLDKVIAIYWDKHPSLIHNRIITNIKNYDTDCKSIKYFYIAAKNSVCFSLPVTPKCMQILD
jgi:hypothetical protein